MKRVFAHKQSYSPWLCKLHLTLIDHNSKNKFGLVSTVNEYYFFATCLAGHIPTRVDIRIIQNAGILQKSVCIVGIEPQQPLS